MATADEILAGAVEVASEGVTEDKVLRIDNELRTINIPSAVKLLGVESDEDVNIIEFEMPRYYGEFDLSEFSVRINYMNANGDGDIYKVIDLVADEEKMSFSWLVGRFASAYKGTVQFIVCLKKLTEELVVEKEFNTTLARLPVLEGLETNQQVLQNYPDIIEQMLKYMETPVSSEEIGKAVEEYLEENPVGGATINDEEVSAGSVWSSQKTSSQIDEKVSDHNTDQTTHADIRNLIIGLTNRLNVLADSDDTTLDQLSEIVAYIKSNKDLIDAITTSKVSVSDIVDNLVTNSSNKPLSAAQGVKLKALIDAIVPVTVDSVLSSTSTNPVQNKAVLSGLNEKENKGAVRSVQIGSDAYQPDNEGLITLPEMSGGGGVPDGGITGQMLFKTSNEDGAAEWQTPTHDKVGALGSDPNEGSGETPEMGSVPINADQLGGVAASEYALKTDTAPDSEKLNGKTASEFLGVDGTAKDSEKLNGQSSSAYAFFAGDVFDNTSGNPIPLNGFITSDAKNINVIIPFFKPIVADNFTFKTFQAEMRGISGYLNSASGYQNILSLYSVTPRLHDGCATVTIVKDSSFTNVTNNTPVVLAARMRIEFA